VSSYQHPYQQEIETYQYPSSVYTKADPIPYQPFESTTAIFVDTPEALEAMLAELRTAKEIAIDLEHHDTRTYIGIVSLMQISTRTKDWVVDTLKPWRRKLQCLNEVFADPSIVKVLHGAYMDAIWLQRDLGLYLVGLFDTHHAARALGYAGGSLAFLLQKFINFNAQKQYQTADWRIRYVFNTFLVILLANICSDRSPRSCLTTHDPIPTFSCTYTTTCATS
jgi:exosome complex exonuclease RRP6